MGGAAGNTLLFEGLCLFRNQVGLGSRLIKGNPTGMEIFGAPTRERPGFAPRDNPTFLIAQFVEARGMRGFRAWVVRNFDDGATQVMPWWCRITRTLATKAHPRESCCGENIEIRRPANRCEAGACKAGQQMELVTTTAVTQNAARPAAWRTCRGGDCAQSRVHGVNKGAHKEGGVPIIVGVSRPSGATSPSRVWMILA